MEGGAAGPSESPPVRPQQMIPVKCGARDGDPLPGMPLLSVSLRYPEGAVPPGLTAGQTTTIDQYLTSTGPVLDDSCLSCPYPFIIRRGFSRGLEGASFQV